MPTFIKTGFWEKSQKGFKDWLNLDQLIQSLGGSSEWGSITGDLSNQTDLSNVLSDLSNDKADIDSPSFVGTPLVPTPDLTTNSTQVVNTIYVRNLINYVTPEMFGAVGDGVTNDSAAIQLAIDSGYPVFFGPKTYLVNTQVNLPVNAKLFGCGSQSILATTANISILSITVNLSCCQISDLTFYGDRATTLRTSQNGISVVGDLMTLFPVSNHITNCRFLNLGNAGIYSFRAGSSTLLGAPAFQGAIYAVNCYAEGNTYGYLQDTRAEYAIYSNCVATRNTTAGFRIVGGNNALVGGNATANVVGVQLATGSNDGHGVVDGMKLNHNSNNVTSTGITRGYLFSNCMMYGGNITISTSADIKFVNCEINLISVITLTNNTNAVKFIDCRWDNTPVFTLTGTAPYIRNVGGYSAKTANYTLLYSDANTSFTNTGASGTVNFTLPAAFEGMEFPFFVTAAQSLTVTAGTGATIRIAGSVSASAGNITSNTIGNYVKLKAISTTQWVAESTQGTWTVN